MEPLVSEVLSMDVMQSITLKVVERTPWQAINKCILVLASTFHHMDTSFRFSSCRRLHPTAKNTWMHRKERHLGIHDKQNRIAGLQRSRRKAPDWKGQGPTNVHWFTSKILQRATGNFALRNQVGEGQNGSVFHGRLPNNDPVDIAVKKFKHTSADPMQVCMILQKSKTPKDAFVLHERHDQDWL